MISGMFTCALVTAMVGRMSQPAASLSANTSATMWPHGSSDTIFLGSNQLSNGPIDLGRRGVGEVRADGRASAPAPRSRAPGRCRRTPECARRWRCGLADTPTVPTTGPQNLRIARAPDHRGSRATPPWRVGIQSDVSHVLSRCPKAGKATHFRALWVTKGRRAEAQQNGHLPRKCLSIRSPWRSARRWGSSGGACFQRPHRRDPAGPQAPFCRQTLHAGFSPTPARESPRPGRARPIFFILSARMAAGLPTLYS